MTELSPTIEDLYAEHLHKIVVRYSQALETFPAEGFLISSGDLIETFLDDRTYPFKVNPHFNQWLPVTDNPGSFVLFRPGQRPTLYYNQPNDYWHKPPDDPNGYWVDHWDIEIIGSLGEAHNLLGDTSKLVFIGEETELADSWGIRNANPVEVLDRLHFERAYKTDYELYCMRRASEIAVTGHRAAKQAFDEECSEFEIQHRYLGAIHRREQSAPYGGIVALNENAAVLHYQHYEVDTPQTHLSLLIDAGASWNGYAADVTRTYASGNNPFGDLVIAMDEQQQAIIRDIRPGENYETLHEKMQLRIARLLKQFDLVNMHEADMLQENLTHSFMPHGLGHLLGLQTHDVGGYQQTRDGSQRAPATERPALRLTRPIEERQVFTIEPGLYFIPSLLKELRASKLSKAINWPRVESFLPYGGIRIEDNVAIIDGVAINLTRQAFASD